MSARRLPLALFLLVAWVALWEDLSPANVASGVVAVAAVLAVSPTPPEGGRPSRVRPVALARFGAWFAWKLVQANAIVAWETVTPKNDLEQGVIGVPLRGWSPWVTTLVANGVSLTPGTLTLEVVEDDDGRPTIYVHVLHLHDRERARREVLKLEELAIRAFGGDIDQEEPTWTS